MGISTTEFPARHKPACCSDPAGKSLRLHAAVDLSLTTPGGDHSTIPGFLDITYKVQIWPLKTSRELFQGIQLVFALSFSETKLLFGTLPSSFVLILLLTQEVSMLSGPRGTNNGFFSQPPPVDWILGTHCSVLGAEWLGWI